MIPCSLFLVPAITQLGDVFSAVARPARDFSEDAALGRLAVGLGEGIAYRFVEFLSYFVGLLVDLVESAAKALDSAVVGGVHEQSVHKVRQLE